VGVYDIESLMPKIKDDNFKILVKNKDVLKNTTNIYFDRNSKYIACYGPHNVFIIPLETSKLERHYSKENSFVFKLVKSPANNEHYFQIDKKRFDFIIDVQFISDPTKKNDRERRYPYDLLLACKAAGCKNVQIFNT